MIDDNYFTYKLFKCTDVFCIVNIVYTVRYSNKTFINYYEIRIIKIYLLNMNKFTKFKNKTINKYQKLLTKKKKSLSKSEQPTTSKLCLCL